MKRVCLAALALICAATAQAQTAIPVTVDNFNRAQSDTIFAAVVGKGGFGKFVHARELAPPGEQVVVRPDRDTLHSEAVFDLDAGPVTITMPIAGPRFMTMQVIDQDNYTPAVYFGGNSHRLTKDGVGTRYALVVIRTLVDPDDPKDVEQAHALQDAIASSQNGVGSFEVPDWDQASLRKVRNELRTQGETTDSKGMFGARDEVDPARHLIGSAIAWGGKPEKDAFYILVTPARNDGNTVNRMTVPPDVPAWEFWSISVYDADGFFRKNDKAYSLTSFTAKKNADGSVAVQFGGCDGRIPNCLPIMRGWNYMVRLYRPAPEVRDGEWKFPEAGPAP